MMQCFLYEKGQLQEVEPEAVPGQVQNTAALLWVDLEAPTEAEGTFLGRTFGFHPLAIGDCLSPRLRPPKMDDYGAYRFIVVHGIDHNLPPGMLSTHELDIFLGPTYLVTSHRKPSWSIRNTREVCRQTPELMASPDYLAYWIMDSQVGGMLPPVEEQDPVLHRLKGDILRDPRPNQLRTVLDLEEKLLNVRQAILPELRVMEQLAKGGTPLVRESTRPYFNDIHDHLERLRGLLDMLWDMAESNLTIHLSATNNRTADFTKALSLVAMVFLPLALVAGIYGMNFKNMPELDWKYGYFLVIGVILAVGGGLLALYHKKHWI